MKELVGRDERAVAPSAGVDVVTVLAHALRAGRLENLAGCWIVFLWVLFWAVDGTGNGFGWMTEWSLSEAYGLRLTRESLHLPGTVMGLLGITALPFGKPGPGSGTWVLNYAVVSALLWLVRGLSGHAAGVYSVGGPAPGKRGALARGLLTPGILLAVYWATALAAVWNNSANWVAVVFPLLLSVPVWVHRRAVEKVMCDRLSDHAIERQPREEVTGPAWLRRIGRVIDREQRSRIVLYDPDLPFAGLGQPVDPWSVVMDLERKPGVGLAPVTAAEVLDSVREKLTGLTRVPGEMVSRDRLRNVEIDEVVYLPAGPPRHEVDHGEAATAAHLSTSRGEGGEARRHFLRVQVSAWDSQMVVSVLVRVHTQGELLALEIVPHVLNPLRPEFGLLDGIAERGRAFPLSAAAQTLLTAPAAGATAVLSVVGSAYGSAAGAKRQFERRNARGEVPSEGARESVREMAAQQGQSVFQGMDASRYLRTLQERIGTGVLQVLDEKGYDTKELKQQVIQVNRGGIHITSMHGGAVASGQGAIAGGARRPPRAQRRMPTAQQRGR
ncbi:hypothetical protein [Streptomyces gelaticus]|uniref:hypothetical protein n=1 Tax=Streptomyces gelaticus TaxID=285446 RepID=UPI001E3D370D|nr:hypothetical protein [Streptomyces gelaticus]